MVVMTCVIFSHPVITVGSRNLLLDPGTNGFPYKGLIKRLFLRGGYGGVGGPVDQPKSIGQTNADFMLKTCPSSCGFSGCLDALIFFFQPKPIENH